MILTSIMAVVNNPSKTSMASVTASKMLTSVLKTSSLAYMDSMS